MSDCTRFYISPGSRVLQAPGYLKLQIQSFVAPGYLKLWIWSFVAPGGFLTKELLPCVLSQEPVTRPKQFLTKVNKLLVPVTACPSSRLGTRL